MQARATGEIGPYDDTVAQLRGCVALLMERAARERSARQRPAGSAENRESGEAHALWDAETRRPPGAPSAAPVGEPGRGLDAEEDESALDRSAWRNW